MTPTTRLSLFLIALSILWTLGVGVMFPEVRP